MSYSCPLDLNNTTFFLRSPLVKSNVVLACSVHDLGVTLDCHLDINAQVNQLWESASLPIPWSHLNSSSVTACYMALQIKKSLRFSEFKTSLQDWLHEPRGKNISHQYWLRKLHWLPIKKRIIYKILVLLLTYKSLKGLALDYLRHRLIRPHCACANKNFKIWIETSPPRP